MRNQFIKLTPEELKELIERTVSEVLLKSNAIHESVLFYKRNEAAKKLGVTPQTVSNMVKDGRLTNVNVNGHFHIPRKEVDEYFQIKNFRNRD